MDIPEDFRVCFPEKRIYVSRDHNWAFAAWELHNLTQKVKPHATLIHVDAHLDDVWDGILVEGLDEIKKTEDVIGIAGKLKIDNFIWPAVKTGTIDNVIYVSQMNYGDEPFDFDGWDFNDQNLQPVKDILENQKYNGVRYWNIEEFIAKKDSEEVQKLVEGRGVILDLDLDYFNENHNNLLEANLMEEQKIINNLTILRYLYPWSLITIALSPMYCGGKENAEYLLGLFYKVFGVNPEEGKGW